MAVTEKQLKNLIPPKKGEIRNPKGKRKGVLNTRTRLLKLLGLIQLKKNKFTGGFEEFSVAEQMDMAMVLKALKGDVTAYREILDRLEGKAKQDINQKLDGKLKLEIVRRKVTPDNT